MIPTKSLTITCLILDIIIGVIGIIDGFLSLAYQLRIDTSPMLFMTISDLVVFVTMLVFSIIYSTKAISKWGDDYAKAVPFVFSFYCIGGVCELINVSFHTNIEALPLYIATLVFFLSAAVLLIIGVSLIKKTPEKGAVISIVGFSIGAFTVAATMFGVTIGTPTGLTVIARLLVLLYCAIGIYKFK